MGLLDDLKRLPWRVTIWLNQQHATRTVERWSDVETLIHRVAPAVPAEHRAALEMSLLAYDQVGQTAWCYADLPQTFRFIALRVPRGAS